MNDPTPLVKKFLLQLPPPSLRDNTAEIDRLKRQLKATGGLEHLTIPFAEIPRWVSILRKADYRVTATVSLAA